MAEPEVKFTSPAGHPKDRILIHENMDIPKEGMFISLNGYPFLARPGVEVDIPRPVRLMLDTRIRTETIQNDDGKDTYRDVPRLTYTLLAENVMSDEDLAEAAETLEEVKIPVSVLSPAPKVEDPFTDEA
jgi:hypothetical protein